MTKCYVIRNKDCCYYYNSVMLDTAGFTPSLASAYFWVKEENAKMHINANKLLLNDCEVVKCTICEGDLEKELAVRDKALELQKKFAEDIIYKMNYCGGATCDDIKSNEYFIDEARKELEE